jgi:diguanylate cyclase (GGDEF)-like protein
MEESNSKVCHYLTAIIGIVVVCASLAAFVGTRYDITLLTSVSSSWANIKINSAICFFMAGVALLLSREKNRGAFNYILVVTSSIIILLISGVTIIEYLFGVDLRIDQLIMNDVLFLHLKTIYPGRMAFITALTFMFVAFSFLLLTKKSISNTIAQTFAWLILFLALISFFNYFYGASTSSVYQQYTTMSVLTMSLFILLGVGILLVNPESGIIGILLKDNNSGHFLRRIIPIPIIFPLVLFQIILFLERKGFIDSFVGIVIAQITLWGLICIMIILAALLLDRKEKNITDLNRSMAETLEELKQVSYEQDLLNNLYELLLSCKDSSEAYPVIDMMARKLFLGREEHQQEVSGGLAIYNKATQTLELVGQGGERLLLEEKFSPSDCWALREGHNYLIDTPQKNILCTHFKTPPPGGYICIPLLLKSEIVGLLHQNAAEGSTVSLKQQRRANSFAAVVKFSIANIKLNEALNEASTHDPLTGLFNRRYLDEILPRELNRARRLNHIVCVAMMDLDGFKKFNDSMGHEAGDEILRFIGNLLLKHFRDNDVVCRFGGEEFVVVLLDTDFDSAIARIESVCAEVKNAKVTYQNQVLPSIAISIGVAQAPLDGETMDEIIRASDTAMYEAKKAGGNSMKIFSRKA